MKAEFLIYSSLFFPNGPFYADQIIPTGFCLLLDKKGCNVAWQTFSQYEENPEYWLCGNLAQGLLNQHPWISVS